MVDQPELLLMGIDSITGPDLVQSEGLLFQDPAGLS